MKGSRANRDVRRSNRGRCWCLASRPRILFRTMWRNAFFAVLLGLFVACSQSEDSGGQLPESGQAGASSSSSSSGSKSGSASGSSGTGGATFMACDDAGMCGDYVSGCTGCAVSSACAEVYDGCFGDAICLDFNKCLAGCKSDQGCRDMCAMENPVGADRYKALVTCIVCQVCPNSCAEFASFCL